MTARLSDLKMTMFRRTKGSQKAFTLVELLVVIAIVAILASFLISFIGSSRKKSLQAAEISNMRTIGLAFLAYEADRGRFPYAADSSSGPYWDQSLVSNGYLASSNYVKSPADKIARTSRTALARSYSINAYVASFISNGTTPGTTLTNIIQNIQNYGIEGYWTRSDKGKSKVVVLHWRPTPAATYGSGGSLINTAPTMNGYITDPNASKYFPLGSPTNNLTISFLFGDAHVELIDLSKVTNDINQINGFMEAKYFRAK
jgi:prepilin-type N-terminal cleavage/methylation domain-containing protein